MPKPGSAKMLPGGGVMLNPQSEPSGKGSPGWDPGDKPAEFLPSTQGAAPGQGGGEKGIIIVNSKSYVPLPEGSNLGPGDMEAKGIVIVNSKPFMPAPQGAAPGQVGIVTPTD